MNIADFFEEYLIFDFKNRKIYKKTDRKASKSFAIRFSIIR